MGIWEVTSRGLVKRGMNRAIDMVRRGAFRGSGVGPSMTMVEAKTVTRVATVCSC